MTQYISTNVNLTENQMQKLRQAVNANCAATSIRINADDLDGDHTIFLTNAQHRKLENAREQGKGLTIKMSSKQLKHNVKTQGGFLGALLPALAGIGRAVACIVRSSKKGGSSFSYRCPFWFSVYRSKQVIWRWFIS